MAPTRLNRVHLDRLGGCREADARRRRQKAAAAPRRGNRAGAECVGTRWEAKTDPQELLILKSFKSHVVVFK